MTILTEFAKIATLGIYHVLVLLILCQVCGADICPQYRPLIAEDLPETEYVETSLDQYHQYNTDSQRVYKLTVCTHPILTEQISFMKVEHTG